jgi:dolichol-phosphate mannosyltransferase
MKNLSVIIPVFNEAENVPFVFHELISVLEKIPSLDFEVIWIDDGSVDGTSTVLKQIKDARSRVIQFDRHLGKTAAVFAGVAGARFDVIATMDGDAQDDPADLPRLLKKLDEGFDMVCGSRVHREDTFVKKASSAIARAVRQAVLGDNYWDVVCPMKVFSRSVVRPLPSFEGMHRYLPIFVERRGGRVAEVKVSQRARRFGRSKYGIMNRLKLRQLWQVRKMLNNMERT